MQERRSSGAWRGLGLVCLVAVAVLTEVPMAEPALPSIRQVRLDHGPVSYELIAPKGCDRPADAACPLVVLIAGYAVPMVVWDGTRDALLGKGFSVLRFDFYGRGRSARPQVEYTPDFFADQIWELVTAKQLDLPRCRFHIVASSMGGAVAAVFANRHPEAVDRVVLVSPAGLSVKFPTVTTLLKAPGLGRWYFDQRFRQIMLDHLQENLYTDVHLYPKVLVEFRRQLEVPGTADAMFSTLRLTVLRDLTEEFYGLGGLRRPTRVIWGVEDQLVPLRDSRKTLERAIPHLEIRQIAGAGHLPQLEQPRAFNALVSAFLAQP